jgi:hypothetical protein
MMNHVYSRQYVPYRTKNNYLFTCMQRAIQYAAAVSRTATLQICSISYIPPRKFALKENRGATAGIIATLLIQFATVKQTK